MYGGGILGTAVATLVMPGAARISPYLVAVLSVVQGLFAVSCFQNFGNCLYAVCTYQSCFCIKVNNVP